MIDSLKIELEEANWRIRILREMLIGRDKDVAKMTSVVQAAKDCWGCFNFRLEQFREGSPAHRLGTALAALERRL